MLSDFCCSLMMLLAGCEEKATHEALRLGPHQDACFLRLGSQTLPACELLSLHVCSSCDVYLLFSTRWYMILRVLDPHPRTHTRVIIQYNRALKSNHTVIKQYNRALKNQSDSTQTVHSSAREQSHSTPERSNVQSERSDVIGQQSSST